MGRGLRRPFPDGRGNSLHIQPHVRHWRPAYLLSTFVNPIHRLAHLLTGATVIYFIAHRRRR